MRRPTHVEGEVACPQCGRTAACLGTQIRIPPASSPGAWEELRAQVREWKIESADQARRSRVRQRHVIERQIAALQLRPNSEERTRGIQQLREQLASVEAG